LNRQQERIEYKPLQMAIVGLQNQYSWVQIPSGAPVVIHPSSLAGSITLRG
jgi:hypothetical protein